MNFQTISALLERFAPHDLAGHYGEPGYDDPISGIILANWNYVPKHIFNGLERRGYSLEWPDEWIKADNDKIYRAQPDSYGWKPYYWITSGCVIIGGDDVEADPEGTGYLGHLINNPETLNVFDVDLTKFGFKLIEGDLENGWHAGMDANPKKILANLQEKYPEGEFIFSDYEPSQFYIRFSVWGRNLND